ncbi:hypothetical protein ACS0TY_030053 [Phlomoides rotata]
MVKMSIDSKSCLCNGMRVIITKLGNHITKAQVFSGKNVGNKVLIPRMTLSGSDVRTPIKFRMRQFSILLCFVMTINKS